MPKVLILYASRKGSTAEVASYLAELLQSHHIEVDVADATEFKSDVKAYDAVLIGTGIYHGLWLNPLWNNVRRLIKQLAQIPVWGFALCVRILEAGGEAHIQQHYVPHKILDEIKARDFRFFAGRIDDLTPSELASFGERYDGEYLHRRGDYRDWDAIHAYGLEIVKALNEM